MERVTETNAGRIRQLFISVIVAVSLVIGLWVYVNARNLDAAWWVFAAFAVAEVLVAVNYVNENALVELFRRMPLPKRLTGGEG